MTLNRQQKNILPHLFKDKTESADYTGKGLVMPVCGNGHAHYLMGYGIKSVIKILSPDSALHFTLMAYAPRE